MINHNQISLKSLWGIIILFMFFFCGPPKPIPNPDNPRSELPAKSEAELLADLDSPEWSDRTEAILELASIPSERYIPRFRSLLKEDPNPNVRGTAAIALGEVHDKESTPAIIELLKPDSGISADIVLDALFRMEDVRAAKPILPLLESDIHAIRLEAVDVLAHLNDRSLGKEILMMANRSKDEEKNKTYAMVLGKLRIKESEDWLISLAGRTKPSPTLAATYLALGRIESKKGIPLLAKALGGDFDKGRENSAEALIHIKDKSSIPFLLGYLENQSHDIRYLAGNVLIQIQDQLIIDKCIKLLEENKKVSIGVASYILGRFKSDKARILIEDALEDKTNAEREVIAQSLGWIHNKESIPLLISVMEEKDGEGKYGAAWSLGIFADKSTFKALEKATSSSDFRLASIATESISNLRIPEVIPVMEKRISENKNISVFALRAIANTPGVEARNSLENFAKSKEPTIYNPAIENIGHRREKESIPFLMNILKDNDSNKMRVTVAALVNITDKHFFSPQEWLNWYDTEWKE